MTSLFKQRKPRGYHHQMIYSDERRERLKAMEEKARQDLGISPTREVKPEDFRGAFSRNSHLRKKNGASLLGSMPTVIMVMLILALFLLMLYLAHNP